MEYVVEYGPPLVIVMAIGAIVFAAIVSKKKQKSRLDPNVKKAAISTFLNLK